MTARKIGKKLLRFILIFFGVLVVLVAIFHWWFVAHAKDIVEDMVKSKSHGLLRLKIQKFKFGYFSSKMEVDKAVFYNTDTLTANTSYRFNVEKIKLNVGTS